MMKGDDFSSREEQMGAKSEALAKQYEAKVQEATAAMEKISEADWKKTTAAEKWAVGVVAHHVAGGHEGISGIIKTVASGQSMPNFTMDMLDGMNAKHAQEFASVGKAETVALHKKNAAAAAEMVRGLSDADLARTGVVLTGMPAMNVEQIITNILINHIDDHFGSIRKTVG
jgi:mycothiol maleylpyruvate isomerase-like protein